MWSLVIEKEFSPAIDSETFFVVITFTSICHHGVLPR